MTLQRIRAAIRRGDFIYSFHFRLRQIVRGITKEDIQLAIGNDAPEIIEDNPDDPRGHSCLIYGESEGGVLHVLCTVKPPIVIITCYRPDPDQWYNGFRRRKSHEVS